MNVRFFNTYEPVVPLFRDLVPALTRRGAEVQIVVSSASYRTGQPLREFFEHQPDVRVVEAPSLGSLQARRFGKLRVMLGYVGFAIPASLFGRGVDLNVFLSQPPLFSIWGSTLRVIRQQRYVCMLMDLYPHLLVELGFMHRGSLRARIAHTAMSRTIRAADAVVVVGRCMREIVLNMGVDAGRVHVVPAWPNDTVVPVSHADNGFRRGYAWADKFVVMYAGNIGYPQDFDDLLDAAGLLADRDDIAFVFIGTGAREAVVRADAGQKGLRNVHFLPFLQDRYPLKEIMSAADLHFVTLRSECTGLAVPSKAYAALAAGRPILYVGGEEGEIPRVVREHGVGAALVPGDPAGLASTIVGYADDPQRWLEQCEAARTLTMANYQGRTAAERLADILLEASGSPPQGPV